MLPVVTQEKMMTSSFEVVNGDEYWIGFGVEACGCAANERRTSVRASVSIGRGGVLMGRFDNDTCSQVYSSIKMNTNKSHLYVQYVRQLARKPTNDVGNTGPSQETTNSKCHPLDW